MESGVLRNECEPEARAAGSRVHRKSGPPPPVRSDPTLNAWARHCTALQAQCFTGPTLESGNTQAPGGIPSFPVPTPEAWARHCTALQAQCFTGPTLESGNTQAPGGIRSFPVPTPEAWARHCTALQAQCFTGPTLESGNTQAPGGIRSFPVPTPEAWARHCTALQAQCFTRPTLESGNTQAPGGIRSFPALFRVGKNRVSSLSEPFRESGHADHSADRDPDAGSSAGWHQPGRPGQLLDPWTGG